MKHRGNRNKKRGKRLASLREWDARLDQWQSMWSAMSPGDAIGLVLRMAGG